MKMFRCDVCQKVHEGEAMTWNEPGRISHNDLCEISESFADNQAQQEGVKVQVLITTATGRKNINPDLCPDCTTAIVRAAKKQ